MVGRVIQSMEILGPSSDSESESFEEEEQLGVRMLVRAVENSPVLGLVCAKNNVSSFHL